MLRVVSADTPVVEVGATVTVRDEATGSEQTWEIVTQRSGSRTTGELTVSTPVAQALLGRSAGESVEVRAAKIVRLTILSVVAASPQRVPAPRELPDVPIAEFSRGQDGEYQDWVRENPDGYVLSRGNMIHLADCGHLGLDAAFTLAATSPGRPRLCSRSRTVLEHRARDETGDFPARCSTCFR